MLSIELSVKDNHIVIQKPVSLAALLTQITPDNIHAEIETGPSVGGEIW